MLDARCQGRQQGYMAVKHIDVRLANEMSADWRPMSYCFENTNNPFSDLRGGYPRRSVLLLSRASFTPFHQQASCYVPQCKVASRNLIYKRSLLLQEKQLWARIVMIIFNG